MNYPIDNKDDNFTEVKVSAIIDVMFRKFFLKLIICLSVFVTVCVGHDMAFAVAVPRLHFNGYVADEAAILDTQTEDKINGIIYDLKNKTTAEIAVVTLNSLNEQSIEDVALAIGRGYGIGAKGQNNGLVFLVVPSERWMRIEVGYGLEGAIPDSVAGRIRDEKIIPYFKQNQYQEGIYSGVYAISNKVAQYYGVSLGSYHKAPEPMEADLSDVIFALVFVLIILWRFSGMSFVFFPGYSSRYSRSSYGGSSFGGFSGGGGFGGGGASGRW